MPKSKTRYAAVGSWRQSGKTTLAHGFLDPDSPGYFEVWNAAEIGSAMSADDTSVRRYLDLVTSLFMVRQLQPWHENLGSAR